jgi:hypothetical protein
MSASVSTEDFETWYIKWYYGSSQSLYRYTLECSVTSAINSGMEVIAKIPGNYEKDEDSEDLFLFKERVDYKIYRILNKVIKLQISLYNLDYETSFYLLIQKLIISHDFEKSVDLGRVYASFPRKNKNFEDSKKHNYENPMWSFEQFDKVYSFILNEEYQKTSREDKYIHPPNTIPSPFKRS